ncbi:isoprenylcysteine carboxylmethyltransferase family protein [Aureisphaera sp. CAU 1614]|uniref:Isoprenylcysteine carboxylmethyltransferase family protein n=1 Tax=Halomarinibacterium sedimenti TaxID=2857106 RepID=A0A9X1FP65_9FLAO|nr:isoprenylcysteine carboxylmethyltransferase family protein [Halomarinibacterium sedimenti]MBW2938046.1 isoprenylcysteine carboxylmethyltransferase family protein [Halomarinibacterium sedimenti]
MFSLFIRNLFFTILQPGLVAGLIPFWITGFRINNIFVKVWQLHHYIGTIVFLIGFVIMIWCIISFAVKGRGTLSPIDPTKRLVVAGLYKFSRNPMYVGVTLILIGESAYFQSVELWIYALFVFITFNIFAILIEEPRLRKDFGEDYKRYCEKVRRWI